MKDGAREEYLLPIIADGMLKQGTEFSVLPTDDNWFGVTYKEDKPTVEAAFRKLIEDGDGTAFYPDADSVRVVVDTDNTDQYLLIAQSENGVPKEGNIVYIDQTVGEASGTITFYVYPKTLSKGTYYVYLSSTNGARQLVATFEYYIPRALGDIDGDSKVSSKDSLWALQASVNKRDLDSIQTYAADVDHDGKVSSKDALWILQASVNKRELN